VRFPKGTKVYHVVRKKTGTVVGPEDSRSRTVHVNQDANGRDTTWYFYLLLPASAVNTRAGKAFERLYENESID
jgi:hypothetical protein